MMIDARMARVLVLVYVLQYTIVTVHYPETMKRRDVDLFGNHFKDSRLFSQVGMMGDGGSDVTRHVTQMVAKGKSSK